MTNAIHKWGIEIEAGWKYNLEDFVRKNARNPSLYRRVLKFPNLNLRQKWILHNDGSIEIYDHDNGNDHDDDDNECPDCGNCICLDCDSEHSPYCDNQDWTPTPRKSKRSKKNVSWPWEVVIFPPADSHSIISYDLNRLWKFINEVNDSMGLHIHISTNDSNYSKLATFEFSELFQEKVMDTFPEVKKRISHSDYSNQYEDEDSFIFNIKGQIPCKTKNHYRDYIINYSYGLHGTVEFRAFPMVDTSSRARDFLKFVDREVNSFLKDVNSGKVKVQEILKPSILKQYRPPSARRM